MKILIVGPEARLEECKRKFGTHPTYLWAQQHDDAKVHLPHADVVFDFLIEQQPKYVALYPQQLPVFFNTVNVTLKKLIGHGDAGTRFGFCGWPTFTHREYLEVCVLSNDDRDPLDKICRELNTKYEIVADQVGLVSPRIIAMIINEAYLTAEEGTASRADIDLAMKLGTNYPFGPFEWAQRIGVRDVYSVLAAMKNSLDSERYTISKLLQSEAV